MRTSSSILDSDSVMLIMVLPVRHIVVIMYDTYDMSSRDSVLLITLFIVYVVLVNNWFDFQKSKTRHFSRIFETVVF
jgi:hypothetical protein